MLSPNPFPCPAPVFTPTAANIQSLPTVDNDRGGANGSAVDYDTEPRLPTAQAYSGLRSVQAPVAANGPGRKPQPAVDNDCGRLTLSPADVSSSFEHVEPGSFRLRVFGPTVTSNQPTGEVSQPSSRVIDQASLDALHANLHERAALYERIRRARLRTVLSKFGNNVPVSLQDDVDPLSPPDSIDVELQQSLSEFIRRTRPSLQSFVELWRNQTPEDYRPNKALHVPTIRSSCAGYRHLDRLIQIAEEGVRVETKPLRRQSKRPKNHVSASKRLPVLLKNIAAEQRAGRVLVLDSDILELWPEIQISPFGVVDKPHCDPNTTGRTIHDLSFPDGFSVNDVTQPSSIPRPTYESRTRVTQEILSLSRRFPGLEIHAAASDINAAFRHVPVNSNSIYLFGGLIEELGILVIDLDATFGWTLSPGCYEIFGGATFGWTLSPGCYEIFGGAVGFVHGQRCNEWNPDSFFSYHWVDDHIDVGVGVGNNCEQIARSLRHAMHSVLGPSAINEKKFTGWQTQLQALGLNFDTRSHTVSMPDPKILEAKTIVLSAYGAHSLTRSAYRSLLGSLRHVATCIRPARAFLQRLRRFESSLHWRAVVALDADARRDLEWWWLILNSSSFNGIPMEYFGALPAPDIVVQMDASDHGICALDVTRKRYLTYIYTPAEQALITAFKAGSKNGCDINCRELLSCVFAVHAWGPTWHFPSRRLPIRIHFRIDNTSLCRDSRVCRRPTRARSSLFDYSLSLGGPVPLASFGFARARSSERTGGPGFPAQRSTERSSVWHTNRILVAGLSDCILEQFRSSLAISLRNTPWPTQLSSG
jgi:hypothetical protein